MKTIPLTRSLAGLAAIIAAGNGIFALITWWSGQWRIATFGSDYVPMAPITAILFAVLGLATAIWAFWPESRPARLAGPLGAAIAIAVGALETGQTWISYSLPWDHWLLHSPASVGAIPIGQMAPLTAIAFLLSAGAFLVYGTRLVMRRLAATAASVAAAGGLIIGATVVVSYASGTPLQYDTQAVPMAWLTGLAFMALNSGLLLAGPVGKALWAGSAGDATLPIPDEIRSFTRRLLIVGTVTGGLIALAGFFHLRKEQTATREVAGEELDAIANLKVEQILAWRNERLGEARFLLKARGVVEDIATFAARPEDATARARLIGWLEPIKGGLRYESVQVFNAQAGLLLAIPATGGPKSTLSGESFAAALAGHEPVFTDLQRDPGGTGIHLDLLVPIRPLPVLGETVPSSPGSAPVAVIVLRLNPKQFLFPLIQSWPVPSTTAENLLVRREGDEVVYLNELRHRPGGALTLRRPIHDSRLPAALGARGVVGKLEGRDYRDVAVLATIHQIPNSPWILVSKIDQTEIYAPLRRAALLNGALVASLLLGIALTGAFLWRQRYTSYMLRALAAERERNVLSERLAIITRHANDIIVLLDEDRRIVEANERALAAYGYTLEEMRRLKAEDLRAPATKAQLETDFTSALLANGTTFETNHQNRSGTEFPVEVSARMVVIEGRRHVLSIVRDITERKRTETALRHSEEWHRTIIGTAMNGFWLTDTQGRILEVNEAYCKMSGFSAPELLQMRIADVDACETAEEALTHIWKLMTLGERRFETKQRRKDGSIFDVEINVQYQPVDGGRLVVFVQDITARKQAGAALRTSEERYRSVIETSLDGILFATSDGQILAANAAACRMFECTEEELRQMGRDGTVDVADPRLPRALAERTRTGTFRGELTFKRKGGALFPVEISTTIFTTEDGSKRTSVIVRDISERKKAETALRESHAMIVKLTAQVPGVVYQYQLYPDGRSCFPFASPGMNDIYEVTPEEVQFDATPVFGRLHPEDYERVGSAIQESARALAPFHCEFRVLLPRQGLRWRLSAAVPERTNDGGTLWHGIISDITEQKRAEEALQASEQRYRSILNASPDDITLADLEGRILMVSPAGMKMFGHENDKEALGRPVTDFLVPEDRDKAIARIALMFQGAMPGVNQYRAQRRDGTIFDMEVNSEFVRDGAGKPTHLIFVARDITARIQAEAKIALSARKLLAVLNASPLPHALNDENQNITFLNAAFVRTFGYTLEDIPVLAAWWPKAYPDPQYRSKVAAAWQAALDESKRTGADFQPVEVVIRCKDGTDKTVLARAAPLAESLGGEHLVVMEDITERKAAEVALLKANDRLSLAIRAGGVGIWDFDLVNNRLIWDEVMYRLYGTTADQFEGAYTAWQHGLHPEDRARGDAEIQAALRGEKEFDTEFRVLWPDGRVRNIRALAMVQRDTSGQPLNMIGTNWDITAQKQAEETLQISLLEKEALLKEVHHRVKNNLQVITSLLRLESGRSLQPDTKSVLGDMQGRIRSMAMLHEALYRSGTFAAVDLGVYIKQITTQLFRALVTTPGSIQLLLDLTAVPVDMDQAMPCGLLVNELVSNSLKHGFPNGRTGEVRVELQRVNGGPQLRLRMSDNGVGLPVDLTSRQDRSLGLRLVGDLTRQLEGTIEVGSGPGASFTVTFTPRMDAISSPFATQSTHR